MTAHSTKHPGLREHSVASPYPVIIVGRGVSPTTWEVHLGTHILPGLTLEQAEKYAHCTHREYTKYGWDRAVEFITIAKELL